MNTLARITLIALAVAIFPRPAQAGILFSQAVCSVRLSPGQLEGLGRSGGLIVSSKQDYADCADFTKPFNVTYFCSTTPTNGNCTTDARAHYSEGALMGLLAALIAVRHQLDVVDIFIESGAPSARGQQIRVGSN